MHQNWFSELRTTPWVYMGAGYLIFLRFKVIYIWELPWEPPVISFDFWWHPRTDLDQCWAAIYLWTYTSWFCLRSNIYMKTRNISNYQADWFFDTRTNASLYRYTGCHEAEEIRLNLCWQCHGRFDITSKDAQVTELLLQYRWCFFESGPWISCCLCHH